MDNLNTTNPVYQENYFLFILRSIFLFKEEVFSFYTQKNFLFITKSIFLFFKEKSGRVDTPHSISTQPTLFIKKIISSLCWQVFPCYNKKYSMLLTKSIFFLFLEMPVR